MKHRIFLTISNIFHCVLLLIIISCSNFSAMVERIMKGTGKPQGSEHEVVMKEKEEPQFIFDDKILNLDDEKVFGYIARSIDSKNILKAHGGFLSPKDYNPNNISYDKDSMQNILKVLVHGFDHDEDSKSNEYTVEEINKISDQHAILTEITGYNYHNTSYPVLVHRHRYSEYQRISSSPVINATLNTMRIMDNSYLHNKVRVSGSIYIDLNKNQEEKIVIKFMGQENLGYKGVSYRGVLFGDNNKLLEGKLIIRYYKNGQDARLPLEYDIANLSDEEKAKLRMLNCFTIL